MIKKWMIYTIVLLGIIGLSIVFGPTLFYKPVSSNTEKAFVFDYVIHDDESNYETLGASVFIKHMETEEYEIVEIHYYDDIILEQIAQDFKDLTDVLVKVNFDAPSDLSIIEHDGNLELVIYARFGKDLFYQKEIIYVSNYFNIILPVTGGISLSQVYTMTQIFGNAGYLAGTLAVAEYSYDTPIVMHYIVNKSDFANQKNLWDLQNYRLYLGSYVEDGMTILETTKMIITP